MQLYYNGEPVSSDGISQEIIDRVVNDESNIITEQFNLFPPTKESWDKLEMIYKLRCACMKK